MPQVYRRRLLPALLKKGHQVSCLVRDKDRLDLKKYNPELVIVVEGDLMTPTPLRSISKEIYAAYYLVHSMNMSGGDLSKEEQHSAGNLVELINSTQADQIIYLSGIVNEDHLSMHLASRKTVEDILRKSTDPVIALLASIIVGAGSASFKIIRDLVEKLPVMIAPRWIKTRCQPIPIRT